MRLRQLGAEFLGEYSSTGYRRLESIEGAQGVIFQCPKCAEGKPPGEPDGVGFAGAHSVLCWFTNPRNAAAVPVSAFPGPGRWTIEGSSIDDLTLHPSVHLSGAGCGWHGWVKAGDAS